MADEDFDEEDVWAFMVKERKNESPTATKPSAKYSPPSAPPRLPTSSRLVPRSNAEGSSRRANRQSAPVNIPDWSKIYNRNESFNVDDVDGGNADDADGIPPHEWLAKKLQMREITSFSVCEGAGRTLKGRDLSNVRNAVLSKTGFLE